MLNTYLILAVIIFIVSIIYFAVTSHPDDRKASFPEKLMAILVITLIGPAILMGLFMMFGIGLIGHGG